MQFPVGAAFRDLPDLAAGLEAARFVSSQRCFPFSHPLFSRGVGLLASKYLYLRAQSGLFWCSCGRKAHKGAKRDHKWQEREDRVVNLQTVVLGLPGASCDPQANIMVSLCVSGSSGSQNGALQLTAYSIDYGDEWNQVSEDTFRQTTESPFRFLMTLVIRDGKLLSFFSNVFSRRSSCCIWHVGL